MTSDNTPSTESIAKIDAEIAHFIEVARPVIERAQEVWREIQPALQVLAENVRILGPRTREALLELGSHGWYMDPSLPVGALFQLSEAFSIGSTADANRILCDWIDNHLEEAEERLVNKHPSREQLVREAFAAHRQNMYAASIPLFLTQADGLCQEVHSIQLYQRSGQRMKLEEAVRHSGIAEFEQTLLAPLLEPLPIVANQRERVALNNHLNRHAILHGESIDYGTRENSCRAISLLTYTSWALLELWPNNAMESDA